jgi:hypothetical protein
MDAVRRAVAFGVLPKRRSAARRVLPPATISASMHCSAGRSVWEWGRSDIYDGEACGAYHPFRGVESSAEWRKWLAAAPTRRCGGAGWSHLQDYTRRWDVVEGECIVTPLVTP